jgi:hypothetical protein
LYQKDVYILLRQPRGLEKTEQGGQRQNSILKMMLVRMLKWAGEKGVSYVANCLTA